jgi:hypothetical protein
MQWFYRLVLLVAAAMVVCPVSTGCGPSQMSEKAAEDPSGTKEVDVPDLPAKPAK